MLFQTPTQFVILGLLLVIGWLFGLASHPGGRKWRARYDAERLTTATYRDEVETQIRAGNTRIAELQRENSTLRSDLAAARAARPGTAPVAAAAAAQPAFAPAPPAEPKRGGWFSWGGGDDLSRIRGLDAATAAKLKAEGVTRYADIAGWSDTDELALETRIGLPVGTVQREQWREQASLLAEGKADEHRGRFG